VTLRDSVGPVLLATFFVVAVFLVPPRGEFPVNDDWDYSATVSDLLHYGEIRLSDWPAMTLVGQILWGGLFAKVLGLSFLTLRLSVICLAFLGALALYYWARAIDRSRLESFFLGLLYAASPLVFSLSYSFMTDVPGASLMLLCLLVQAQCARRGGAPLYLLAGVLASVAYLFRQTAALPALVLAASLVPAVLQRRARARDLLALTAPLALVVAGHRYWLDRIHGRPYQASLDRLPLLRALLRPEYQGVAARTILEQAVIQSLAVCVYLAPLLLCLVGSRAGLRVWRSSGARFVIAIVLLGVPALMGLAGLKLPPANAQIVNDFYLGFECLSGLSALRAPKTLSIDFFSVATLIGLLSLGLAAGLLFVGLRSGWGRWRRGERYLLPISPSGQAGLTALALMGLLVVQRYPFDRYLVAIIPVLGMFLLSLMPRGRGLLRSPLSWSLLTMTAVFSVVGTQDYFVRGRTRLQAVDYLLSSGVKPHDIRASYEDTGLSCFSPHYRQPVRVRPYLLDLSEAQRRARLKKEDPNLVWREPREYEVAYGPVADSEELAVFPYRSWIRSGRVLVYRRLEDAHYK